MYIIYIYISPTMESAGWKVLVGQCWWGVPDPVDPLRLLQAIFEAGAVLGPAPVLGPEVVPGINH